MTDLAVHEVLAMWSSNAQTAFSIYLTLTFAYLSAAYFVGSKLSAFQAFALSGLYFGGASSGLISCVNQMVLFSAVIAEHPEVEAMALVSGEFWVYGLAPLMSLGILVSLYFM